MSVDLHRYGPNIIASGPNGSWDTGVWAWHKYEVNGSTRRKKPKGLDLILQPTTYWHQSHLEERAMVLYTYPSYTLLTYSPFMAAPQHVNGIPLDGGNAVWGDLYKNLKNTKFDSGTFLGELPETVQWLAKVSREMMDAYLAIKRGRWVRYLPTREIVRGRKGRRYVRVRGPRHRVFTFTRRDGTKYNARLSLDGRLANRYLEWRFAVLPVVQEVGNILDSYYEQALNPMISCVRGHFTRKVPLTGYYQDGYRRETYRAIGYYRIETSTKVLQQWGGLNVVSTFWNLLPLSFMVDRFLPIGDFLSNLDAELGVTWMARTTSVVYSFEMKTKPPNGSGVQHRVSTCRGKGYIREVKSFGNSLSDFTFDRVDFQSSLDILALLRTIGGNLLSRK